MIRVMRLLENDALIERRIKEELATAAERTSQLIRQLAAMPDQASRYNYLAEERSEEIFLYDGFFWKVGSHSLWHCQDKNAGVEVANPITLVGIEGASSLRGKLSIPAKIKLPGLTLGIMVIDGIAPPPDGCASWDMIRFDLYKDVSLWGLDVDELEIADSITTLRNISEYRNLKSFRFPNNFREAAGLRSGCLCNCPKLETVEFGQFPIYGNTTFFEECPALNRFIVPDLSWLGKLSDQANDFCDVQERNYVDYTELFEKRRNKITGEPITIEIRDAEKHLSHFEIPESYEEAYHTGIFLEQFPHYYEMIKSVVMRPQMKWIDDEDSDCQQHSLDMWCFGDDKNRSFPFRLENCVNLECLTLPDRLKNIPLAAFTECVNLREVHLPASLEYIGQLAFAGLRHLTHIEFPSSVRRICGNAFAGTGLTEVVLPAECELEPEAFDSHVVITRTGLHPTV